MEGSPVSVGRVFLLPGEMHVGREATEIATLLGSCVAVCLYNRIHHFGGMNHYMSATNPAGQTPSGRHGDYSTELLLKMMLAYSSNIGELEASILGGGNVIGHLSIGTGIGAQNIVMAGTVLEKYRIPVAHRSIGGDFGRKVHFKSWTGQIEVRKIEKSAQTQMAEQRKTNMAGRRIKVLIVDDSQTVRSIIRAGISEDSEIEVVGEAANPYEARELMLEQDPDVILLDIIMPKMDGITFLKKIFQYKPKPVIIISTVAQRGSKLREQAEMIGAVEVLDKEELCLYKGLEVVRLLLVNKIKTAAAVIVQKKSEEDLKGI
ncbi:MAG: response regulator [Candidatus Omnitrophota bacterium]